MKLEEKYISTSENNAKPDETKIILTNEAYAICEFLEKLILETNATRLR